MIRSRLRNLRFRWLKASHGPPDRRRSKVPFFSPPYRCQVLVHRLEQVPVVLTATNRSIVNRVPKIIAKNSKIGSRYAPNSTGST